MKNNNYYPILFENLYNDFKNRNQLTKYKKRLFIIFNLFTIALLFLQITYYIFNIPLPIYMILNIMIILILIFSYIYQSTKFKKNITDIMKTHYNELDVLLKIKKYKKLNTLSRLDELKDYLIQKQSSLLFEKNQNKSRLIIPISFLSSTIVSYFINEILKAAEKNIETFVMIFTIITIMIIVLIDFYLIIDLYTLCTKDDEKNIELLINLIINQKNKILDNSNKSILNKIKFILKLDEFY